MLPLSDNLQPFFYKDPFNAIQHSELYKQQFFLWFNQFRVGLEQGFKMRTILQWRSRTANLFSSTSIGMSPLLYWTQLQVGRHVSGHDTATPPNPPTAVHQAGMLGGYRLHHGQPLPERGSAYWIKMRGCQEMSLTCVTMVRASNWFHTYAVEV